MITAKKLLGIEEKGNVVVQLIDDKTVFARYYQHAVHAIQRSEELKERQET